MKIKKYYLYPLLFYKVFPNLSTINLSPFAFLFLLLDLRFTISKLRSFYINLWIPNISFALLLIFQITLHGISLSILKSFILTYCSIFGGLYLAFKISELRPKIILAIFSFYYLLISIINLSPPEGNIYFKRNYSALSGLTGFGGLSTPVLFYGILLSAVAFKKTYKKILSIFIISFLFIMSLSNTDFLIYMIGLLVFPIIILFTSFKQTRLFFEKVVFNKYGIYLLFLIISILSALCLVFLKDIFDTEIFVLLDGASSFRLSLASEAYKSFLNSKLINIIFGHGLGIGYINLSNNSELISNFWNEKSKMIHNSFLTIIYDTGILGAILIFNTFAYIFTKIWTKTISISHSFSNKNNNKFFKSYIYLCLICVFCVFVSFAGVDKYTDLLTYTIIFLSPLTLIKARYNL